MGEAASVGTPLAFVPAGPTSKRLELVCVAVERMRRTPGHVHLPSTGRASRPIIRAKSDLHDIRPHALIRSMELAGAASALHRA